ncbi:MAG: hypothetical protein JNM67_01245 [Bacteroidetes bacterium]|nr:hypothetical protein [Bacteroidota bacterium]
MRSKVWIWLLPLLLLSSCFEFIEEISFETEQSGVFEATINCSESRVRLKNIIKLDTFMGYNLPSEYEVRTKMSEIAAAIAKVKGISDVQHHSDEQQFIFKLKFHFDSIKHLNQALNTIAALESERHPLPYMSVYEVNDGVFKRLQIPHDSLLRSVKQSHIKLFEGATVTSIYRFKKYVEKVSNSKAIVSKSKTAVMLKQNITDVATKPSILANTISLK